MNKIQIALKIICNLPETNGILFYDTNNFFNDYSIKMFFDRINKHFPFEIRYAQDKFDSSFIEVAKSAIENYKVKPSLISLILFLLTA